MTALKRSLAQEGGEPASKPKRRVAGDRRQRNLLLPLEGKGRQGAAPALAESSKRRRKA